jgi:hypothetical protein
MLAISLLNRLIFDLLLCCLGVRTLNSLPDLALVGPTCLRCLVPRSGVLPQIPNASTIYNTGLVQLWIMWRLRAT